MSTSRPGTVSARDRQSGLPRAARPVGAPGLEPGASALSGPRSDHLSYAPPLALLGLATKTSPRDIPSGTSRAGAAPHGSGRRQSEGGRRVAATAGGTRTPPQGTTGQGRLGASCVSTYVATCVSTCGATRFVSARLVAVRGRSGVRLAPLPAAAPWGPVTVARSPGRRPRLPTGPPGAGAHASPLTTTPLDLGCGPHGLPALPAARPSAPAGSRLGPRGDPP